MDESAPEGTTPAHTLAQLERQAAAVRAELLRLRGELTQVQLEFAGQRGLQLLEANEQLVLAAMRAQAAAKDAESHFDELSALSQHDLLTGLPNRTLMHDRLTTALTLSRRQGTRTAVLFVDLDHFKPINDRLGHAVGDEVLQVAAQRLRSAVRDSDTVSRYGGDEFLVLLTDVSQAADAAHIAAKMLLSLAADGHVQQRPLTLSASVGIAIYPEDGDDAATLIARADAAMYRAKRQGGAGHRFAFDPEAGAAALPAATPEPVVAAEPAQAARAANPADLREANERLLLAALQAEQRQDEAMQAKLRQVQFIAMVVHELRSSVHSFRTAAERLARAASEDAHRLRVEVVIGRQVAHLARLVEDLLHGARSGGGTFRLDLGPVDLGEVLHAAVDACEPAAQARQQQFSLHLPAGPLVVRGDTQRLAQVFGNLLHNASEYTPVGGRVTTSLAHEAGGLSVSVADTGVGIAAEALPRVFDLLVRDERHEALDGGRLGIGLAVVRELVEGHGGKVAARSAGQGGGSEFVVWLPSEPAATTDRREPAAQPSHGTQGDSKAPD